MNGHLTNGVRDTSLYIILADPIWGAVLSLDRVVADCTCTNETVTERSATGMRHPNL